MRSSPRSSPAAPGANPGSHNPILQNQAGDAFTRSLTGGSLRILEVVTYLDPPEHTMVRNIAAEWFRPASLKKWEDRIRELAREPIAGRLHAGPDNLDIVGDFSLSFPLHVIMTLFGVPAEDEPRMMAGLDTESSARRVGRHGSPAEPSEDGADLVKPSSAVAVWQA